MSFDDLLAWIEAHPLQAALFGGAGVLIMLWLFGFFGSSGSSSGGNGLAGAYYAAEAQQAVVGGQIQLATLQTAAATAQENIQANAAEAIALTQANAATTINGQNAGVSLSSNQLAYETAVSHNQTALDIANTAAAASETNTFLGKIVPLEIAQRGTQGFTFRGAPGGNFGLVTKRLTPKQARAAGYTSKEFAAATGLPGW